MENLVQLTIKDNGLNGMLPTELGVIGQLEHLVLSQK